MCILRGTSCQQRRKVIQLHLDSQAPNHTCNLSKTSIKAHVCTETPLPQIKDKISTVASLWWYAPSIGAVSTNQSILAAFQKVVILYNQRKQEIGKATPLHHCGQHWVKITDKNLEMRWKIPEFSIYAVKLKVLLVYVSLKPVVLLKSTVLLNEEVALKISNMVSFVWMGHRTHFCRRFPIKSWRPTSAKTARAKTVRIITSPIFFTDWIKAATIVFKPDKTQLIHEWYIFGSRISQKPLKIMYHYCTECS